MITDVFTTFETQFDKIKRRNTLHWMSHSKKYIYRERKFNYEYLIAFIMSKPHFASHLTNIKDDLEVT